MPLSLARGVCASERVSVSPSRWIRKPIHVLQALRRRTRRAQYGLLHAPMASFCPSSWLLRAEERERSGEATTAQQPYSYCNTTGVSAWLQGGAMRAPRLRRRYVSTVDLYWA